MTDPAVPPAAVPPAAATPAVAPPAAPTPAAVPPATATPATVPALPPKRTNVVGIIAFVIGLIAFLSPVIANFVGFGIDGRLPTLEGLDFFTVLIYGAVGSGVGAVVGIVGIILGFVSLAVRNAKRMWGIIGLSLGFIALVAGFVPLFAFITSGGSSGPTGVPLNG